MADETLNVERDLDTDIPAAVDDVMAMLDKTPATERDENGRFVARQTESETEAEGEPDGSDPEATDDDAAPEDPASGEEVDTEPETAIEPPASWTADAKEAFSKLPPDLQKYVSDRESERDRGINAKLSEAAEARKKYESEAQTTAQERQRYAEGLKSLYQLQAIIDPVLAEGNQTDWLKLSQEDPAGYVQKRAQFEQRVQVMQAVQGEIQRVTQQQNAEAKANYEKRLGEVFPDLADATKAKAVRESWVPVLKQVGFTDQEIENGWSIPHEPRYFKILELAAKGAKAEADRAALPSKKVTPQPAKIVKPQASDGENKGKSANLVALEKRASKSHRMSDQVDLILAMANEGPRK